MILTELTWRVRPPAFLSPSAMAKAALLGAYSFSLVVAIMGCWKTVKETKVIVGGGSILEVPSVLNVSPHKSPRLAILLIKTIHFSLYTCSNFGFLSPIGLQRRTWTKELRVLSLLFGENNGGGPENIQGKPGSTH